MKLVNRTEGDQDKVLFQFRLLMQVLGLSETGRHHWSVCCSGRGKVNAQPLANISLRQGGKAVQRDGYERL